MQSPYVLAPIAMTESDKKTPVFPVGLADDEKKSSKTLKKNLGLTLSPPPRLRPSRSSPTPSDNESLTDRLRRLAQDYAPSEEDGASKPVAMSIKGQAGEKPGPLPSPKLPRPISLSHPSADKPAAAPSPPTTSSIPQNASSPDGPTKDRESTNKALTGPKTTLLLHKALSSTPPSSPDSYQPSHSSEELEDSTLMLNLPSLEGASAHLREEEPDDFEEERTEISPSLLDELTAHDMVAYHQPVQDLSEPTYPEEAPNLLPRRSSVPAGVFDATNDAPLPVDRSTDSGDFGVPLSRKAPGPSPSLNAPPLTAEANGDFAGDKTEVFSSPFENDPICPRLATLDGPSAGQEFLINRMRNSVGRATNNTVVVPDLAMSRKHFEIFQQNDDSFAVRDLVSINGTTLNGTRIKEADLFHGDRIEAGKSTFQFVIHGDVPIDSRQRRLIPAANTRTSAAHPVEHLPGSPAPLLNASTTDRILMGVTIGAALLCIPLVIYLINTVQTRSEEPASIQIPSAQELYFQGVDALQAREWDRAEELFKESYTVDADFGDVPAQLERINNERRAQRIIERAQEARGPLPESMITELQRIADESAYSDQAQSLLRVLRQQQSHELLARAHEAYDNDNVDEALALLDELMALAPQHEGGQRLLRAIDEGIPVAPPEPEVSIREASIREASIREASIREASVDEPYTRGKNSASNRRSSTRPTDTLADPFAEPAQSSRPTERAGSGVVNFTEGFTLYRDEHFDDAIAHFEGIASSASGTMARRASTAAIDVKRFRDALRTAEVHLGGGRSAQARTSLEAARRADQNVAGGSGYFETKLSELFAKSYASEGLTQMRDGNFAAAFDLQKEAETHAPRESTTRQLARGLESEANSLYIQAANQRLSDPDAAAEICRTILAMLPSSHDTYRRTRQMLDEL